MRTAAPTDEPAAKSRPAKKRKAQKSKPPAIPKRNTKKAKFHIKLYNEYLRLVSDGSRKMEIYKHLARKHKLSVGGVRYAIKRVSDLTERPRLLRARLLLDQ